MNIIKKQMFVLLTKVFQGLWNIILKKARFIQLPSCIVAFTSAGTEVITWTVNLISSNNKADVNFQIGINLVRNFEPPLKYIYIILFEQVEKDSLLTYQVVVCHDITFSWYILHHRELCTFFDLQ